MLINHILSRAKEGETAKDQRLGSPLRKSTQNRFHPRTAPQVSSLKAMQQQHGLQEIDYRNFEQLVEKSNARYNQEVNETKKVIFGRLALLDKLVEYILSYLKHHDSDRHFYSKKIMTLASDLRKGLTGATLNEVELSDKRRNNEQLRLLNELLKFKQKSMREMLRSRTMDIDHLREKNLELEGVIKQMKTEITGQNNEILRLKSKLQKLERRIVLMKDSGDVLKGASKIQTTLFELIKENEVIKKSNMEKDHTIGKLNKDIKQIRDSTAIIMDRLESIKLRKGLALQDDADNPNVGFSLNNLSLSYDLAFSKSSDSYSELVGNLKHSGTEKFIEQLFKTHTTAEQRMTTVRFFIQQFTYINQFAEDLNSLFIELFSISECGDIDAIKKRIAREGQQLFRAERCHFWSVDSLTGISKSYNSAGSEIRALSNSGVFKLMFEEQCAIRKYEKEPFAICDQLPNCTGKPVLFNTLLVPIKNRKGTICAFFEVSKAQAMRVETEYYALIMVKFIKMLLEIKTENTLLRKYIKLSESYLDSFVYINSTNHRTQMVYRTKKAALDLFDICEIEILFVDPRSRSFIRTDPNNAYKLLRIDYSKGISGECLKSRLSFLCPDSMSHPKFNGEVDLVCVRPVHYIIILDEEDSNKMMMSLNQESKVIGIIQIAKLKKSPRVEDDSILLMHLGDEDGSSIINEKNAIDKLAQLITITMRAKKNNWKE